MDKFYLIIGESGSGKTTFARHLHRLFGLTQIQSFTTRPPRYPGEYGHTFVDSMPDMNDDEYVVGYTEYNGYQYWATNKQVEENQIYVIDPDGVKFFRDHYRGGKTIITIYLHTSKITRFFRMLKRGDSITYAIQRIKYDATKFKDAKNISDIVINCEKSLAMCTREFVSKVYLAGKGGDAY